MMVDARSYIHRRGWTDRIIISGSLAAAIWPLTSLMAENEPLPYQDFVGIWYGISWAFCTLLTFMQVLLTNLIENCIIIIIIML
jgi:hypothetical protein